MEELRAIPFWIAVAAIFVAVLTETGQGCVSPSASRTPEAVLAALQDAHVQVNAATLPPNAADAGTPPGLCVGALAKLDWLLLMTIAIMGAALIVPARVLGRAQAGVRLLCSLVVLVSAFYLLLKAFALSIVMISLFLAIPFGTIAYIAAWGFFDVRGAAGFLSLIMLMKLIFVVALVLAHQSFLKAKGLVLLTLFSLLLNVVASFVLGLVPGVLASIADAAIAILVAVVALIWSLVILLGSIVPFVKSFRLEHESA